MVIREEWIKIVTIYPKNDTDSVSKFAELYDDHCQTNITTDVNDRFFKFLRNFLKENSNYEEGKPLSKTIRSYDDEVPLSRMTRTYSYGYNPWQNTAPRYSYNYGSAARPRPTKPAPARKNVNVRVNVKVSASIFSKISSNLAPFRVIYE